MQKSQHQRQKIDRNSRPRLLLPSAKTGLMNSFWHNFSSRFLVCAEKSASNNSNPTFIPASSLWVITEIENFNKATDWAAGGVKEEKRKEKSVGNWNFQWEIKTLRARGRKNKCEALATLIGVAKRNLINLQCATPSPRVVLIKVSHFSMCTDGRTVSRWCSSLDFACIEWKLWNDYVFQLSADNVFCANWISATLALFIKSSTCWEWRRSFHLKLTVSQRVASVELCRNHQQPSDVQLWCSSLTLQDIFRVSLCLVSLSDRNSLDVKAARET